MKALRQVVFAVACEDSGGRHSMSGTTALLKEVRLMVPLRRRHELELELEAGLGFLEIGTNVGYTVLHAVVAVLGQQD